VGYVIGTDEAGYAPNLGPLVISATVWQTPGDPRDVDLYRLLEEVVSERPDRYARRPKNRLAIADSKTLYSRELGIGLLERGVLATLGLLDHFPTRWRDVWQAVAPDVVPDLASVPWHAGYDEPVPVADSPADRNGFVAHLKDALAGAGVRLAAMRSRAVFPERFNQLTEHHTTKATVLSALTLDLVQELARSVNGEPVLILCDKHGGRHRYVELLQPRTEWLVQVRGEGPRESVYAWGSGPERREIRFSVGAERFLPVALASMVSKYLRELSMRAFNEFWMRRVPGLRPTAGYPVDAARFKAQIAHAQAALAVNDRVLWRNK
jgi:ribonuclease HII